MSWWRFSLIFSGINGRENPMKCVRPFFLHKWLQLWAIPNFVPPLLFTLLLLLFLLFIYYLLFTLLFTYFRSAFRADAAELVGQSRRRVSRVSGASTAWGEQVPIDHRNLWIGSIEECKMCHRFQIEESIEECKTCHRFQIQESIEECKTCHRFQMRNVKAA
jgi:hypothetical protein